jgi:hypothetical protein
MAAFAIGTETWGSIVCPSAFCGVSGLRPTFGRVAAMIELAGGLGYRFAAASATGAAKNPWNTAPASFSLLMTVAL